MDFEKVAEHLRSTTAPLAVSQIVILTPQGDFTGNGKLRSSDGRIELEVILAGDQGLPEIGGTITREQFWKIGGIIEGQAPFWGLSTPDQHSTSTARFTVRSGRFAFDRIQHLTTPFNDGNLRDALLEAVENPKVESTVPMRGYVTARLSNYKIVWRELRTETVQENPFLGKSTRWERDTLKGELGDFEYALIQRGDDCLIELRLKKEASAPLGEIVRFTAALYRAIAFVHGRHAWPQWERVQGSGIFTEYTTAPRTISENRHTPLTQTTCANGSDATLLIGKAVECFLRRDNFGKGLNDYLFLAREAAANDTPDHVGTLGLCAVFEGIVGFLFEKLCAAEIPADTAQFEYARSKLVAFAKEQAADAKTPPETAGAWTRFLGYLQSARPVRPADKYRQLIEHLRLPAEKMAPALDAWQTHRHPLAHGASPSDDLTEQMFATSRIAGAINVLAAAALGYSGLMVLSRIEDSYIRLA